MTPTTIMLWRIAKKPLEEMEPNRKTGTRKDYAFRALTTHPQLRQAERTMMKRNLTAFRRSSPNQSLNRIPSTISAN